MSRYSRPKSSLCLLLNDLGTNDQSLFAWKRPERDRMSEGLCGLLAPSPEFFRHSRHLWPPSARFLSESFPSTVTNVGLHVRMYLRPLPHEIPGWNTTEMPYEAVLDCTCNTREEDNAQNLSPSIILLALGGDQYARINSNTLRATLSSRSDEQNAGNVGYRYVYIRQNPLSTPLDICVLKPNQLGNADQTAHCSLVDVYPERWWNETSNKFHPPPAQLGSIVVAFRHAFTTSRLSTQVDFFLGLGRRGTAWYYWCTQRRVEDRVDLQNSFWAMEQTAAERDSQAFGIGCDQGGIRAISMVTHIDRKPCLCLHISWQPNLLTEVHGPLTVLDPLAVFAAADEIFPATNHSRVRLQQNPV